MTPCIANTVVHEGKAGVAGDDNLSGVQLEHAREEPSRFGEALQTGVIATVDTAFSHVIAFPEEIQRAITQGPPGPVQVCRAPW